MVRWNLVSKLLIPIIVGYLSEHHHGYILIIGLVVNILKNFGPSVYIDASPDIFTATDKDFKS